MINFAQAKCVIDYFRDSIKPEFKCLQLLLDFSLTVKAAPHECVIRISQP